MFDQPRLERYAAASRKAITAALFTTGSVDMRDFRLTGRAYSDEILEIAEQLVRDASWQEWTSLHP